MVKRDRLALEVKKLRANHPNKDTLTNYSVFPTTSAISDHISHYPRRGRAFASHDCAVFVGSSFVGQTSGPAGPTQSASETVGRATIKRTIETIGPTSTAERTVKATATATRAAVLPTKR